MAMPRAKRHCIDCRFIACDARHIWLHQLLLNAPAHPIPPIQAHFAVQVQLHVVVLNQVLKAAEPLALPLPLRPSGPLRRRVPLHTVQLLVDFGILTVRMNTVHCCVVHLSHTARLLLYVRVRASK